jgi:hypothetical protein
VKVNKETRATVQFSYSQNDLRTNKPDSIFAGLATLNEPNTSAGLLWSEGENRRTMGILSGIATKNEFTENGYYELDSLMNLVKKDDSKTTTFIREKLSIPQHEITIDDKSVLIVDDAGRRWRLPKGNSEFTNLTNNGLLRICREVSTERDLFNCCGTFYELPAENADGFAKIRPIASHNFRIYDYASYLGMLIMTGIGIDKENKNSHIIHSADGKAAVWAGCIDDLWKMGKPVGEGSVWKNTEVKAKVASDPFLIGFYDKRNLLLSHNSASEVKFMLQVDPTGNGTWMNYRILAVQPGEKMKIQFPKNF